MKHQLLGILILSALSTSIHAEPSNTLRFLIDEPMSMWDFGMYKLNKRLDNLTLMPSRKTVNAAAYYSSETNRIRIITTLIIDKNSKDFSYKAANLHEARTVCGDIIKLIRGQFGVDPQKGTVHFGGNSFVCNMFKHDSYQNKNEPKNLCGELDSMVELSAHVTTQENKDIHCQGQLVSNKVFYLD